MQRLDAGHAISAVPQVHLGETIGYVQHLIERALEFSLGYDLQDVLKRLAEGTAVLWLIEKDYIIKGIVVTEMILYPQCKSLNIWLTAGEELAEWKDCFASLEMYARHKGCKYIEAGCRPGLEPILKHLRFNIRRIAAAKLVDTGTH